MRRLLVVMLSLGAIWGSYWVVGSTAMEKGLRNWIDARADEGWVAEYASLETQGFPNRFDTTFLDLQLADPQTGVAWSAPFFQILTLSYSPNHIIAVWPRTQTIASPYQRITIESAEMKGSVVFEPDTALTLDRSTIVLDRFRLASNAGWDAAVERGQLSTRQTPGKEDTHDIAFEALGFRPADQVRRQLDPLGALPETVETLKIDMTMGFDAPWDRYAIEDARPQITDLDLKLVQATWGNLDLRLAGELTVDEAGNPEGRIVVKATNWREMLAMAQASGLVPAEIAPTVENALTLLAAMSGPPETIDAPLSFKNGLVAFGPFPLGRAPRMVIR